MLKTVKEKSLKGLPFFCSFSGGKDSCLALYRAIKEGAIPKFLLTMCVEDGQKTRSHAIPIEVIRAQAESMGISLIIRNTSWDDYEKSFITAIGDFKAEGINTGIFGDIDLEPHRKWEEKVCKAVNIKPILPLWKQGRKELLLEVLSLNFKATIIAVKEEKIDKHFLGRILDHKIIAEFEALGIDACGEEGEYHTVVTDGPLFSKPLKIKKEGISQGPAGYCFLEYKLKK